MKTRGDYLNAKKLVEDIAVDAQIKRELYGLTYRQLAMQLGLGNSAGYLWNVLNHNRAPNYELTMRLLDWLSS